MAHHRPPVRIFDFHQSAPLIQRQPLPQPPSCRPGPNRWPWLLAGAICVLALAGVVVANTPTWTGSSSEPSSRIPAQFRTPLGCDTRTDGECKERTIFQRLCGINIDNLPDPQVAQSGRGVGELIYRDRGEPVLRFFITYDTVIYTCLDSGDSVSFTKDEWYDLDYAGPAADLPPALR